MTTATRVQPIHEHVRQRLRTELETLPGSRARSIAQTHLDTAELIVGDAGGDAQLTADEARMLSEQQYLASLWLGRARRDAAALAELAQPAASAHAEASHG